MNALLQVEAKPCLGVFCGGLVKVKGRDCGVAELTGPMVSVSGSRVALLWGRNPRRCVVFPEAPRLLNDLRVTSEVPVAANMPGEH